jgi:CBS domain containing-hemolysin-like protein
MISFLFALVFMLLALITVAMHQTYNYVPVKELKRLARGGDPLAQALYRAAAYGASLGLLLWIIVAVALVVSFALLQQITPPVLAFIVEAVVVGVGFAWIPTTDLTKLGARLVVWTTPAIAWLLERLQPLFGKITKFAHDHRQIMVHTGLYEREDLLSLLERQKAQPDSRIPHEELELLVHALTFGDKAVGDCMTPRRVVRAISADEHVGPVIIRELHESGHSRFPVYKDKEDNIVGTLYLRDLINLKKTGTVNDVMEHSVYYIHEEYPLEQALHAFLKTKHHLFVVVNRFEEFVGILTIEDIIEQILGCKIVDEFDAYDDMRAVAADHARHEHKAHKKDGEEPPEPKPEEPEKDGENPTEVVE